MGRAVRRVPPHWQHPRSEAGHHVPLFDGAKLAQKTADWDIHSAQWRNGLRADWTLAGPNNWKPLDGTEMCATYAEWAGTRPDPADYMPVWSPLVATHYQMYETTTEGTPISPALASPEELARWLTDTGASAFATETANYDSWLRVCRGGYAPSMVITAGAMTSGVGGLE